MNLDFKELLQAFNDKKVKYLIVGGYAYIHYVEPRYTKDLDIWVQANKENAQKIYQALVDFGAPLEQLNIQQEDFEQEGYFVFFGLPPSRVDILMSIKGLNFDEAWQRRENIEVGKVQVNFLCKEDLITAKKCAGRDQDLLDVKHLEQGK